MADIYVDYYGMADYYGLLRQRSMTDIYNLTKISRRN